MKVLRLFADERGQSCFETIELERSLSDFAPPAPPLYVSEMDPASRYAVIRLPTGWTGERHRSPKRQILFCLRGKVRVTASVGDAAFVSAGEAWLMEDTVGVGHVTTVVSDDPFDAVVIQLPEK
jgi:quercetin dioxygenase-like cupin family protein